MRQVTVRIRFTVACAIVACATVLSAGLVQAQGKFPDRALRLIVPFPPGGQTDSVGRHLGLKIAPILGQQMVVDNRSGASGAIGSAEVARAKPDGYTLLIATTSTHALNPATMANLSYDAIKDFAPLADSNPDKAAEMLKTELDKWAPFIRSLGLGGK